MIWLSPDGATIMAIVNVNPDSFSDPRADAFAVVGMAGMFAVDAGSTQGVAQVMEQFGLAENGVDFRLALARKRLPHLIRRPCTRLVRGSDC